MDPKHLFEEAKLLEQRVTLIDKLLQSLDPVAPDIEDAWSQEVRTRLEALSNGSVELIPGEVVFQNIKKRFQK